MIIFILVFFFVGDFDNFCYVVFYVFVVFIFEGVDVYYYVEFICVVFKGFFCFEDFDFCWGCF